MFFISRIFLRFTFFKKPTICIYQNTFKQITKNILYQVPIHVAYDGTLLPKRIGVGT